MQIILLYLGSWRVFTWEVGANLLHHERIGLFVLMEEAVELPSVGSRISFTVGRKVLGRLVIQLELLLLRGVGLYLSELAMSIRKSHRIPFLTRRLVGLIALFTFAIVGFASLLGLVKVARTLAT